ncbi:MAG: YfgM family protein [Lysobacterales bacterium]
MRNEYYDDHEQGEAVKQWLKTNGMSIFMGIALGIGGLYGWRFWQSSQQTAREQASSAYQQLLIDVDGEIEATRELLDQFRQRSDSDAYATLAAFSLAGQAVADRNYTEAVSLLQFAEQSGQPMELRPIAGLRIARVLLQNGQLAEAMSAVQRHSSDHHRALAEEIRGDILLAQGNNSAAQQAYQSALDNLSGGDRSMLQMKLDNLAVVQPTEPPAAEDAT